MKKNLKGHILFFSVLFGMTANVSAQIWTTQTLPSAETLRSIFFINSNEGWAAGYDGIIHTSTGGAIWSTQLSGSPYRLIAIRFVDANYGWANAGLKVFRTENGGTSWRDMSGIDPNAIIFRNVIFPVSSTVAWATAAGAGQRWFYRYTATSSTTVTEQTFGLIASSAQLYDLWFIDQDNGWAVGLGGQIWKISSASTDSPSFSNQTDYDATTSTLRGVFFLDASNGWAVGEGGAIIKTTDGGTNWSALTSGTTTNLKDLHFYDTNHGCVVGENGLILNTIDGGENWTTETSGVTTTLWSVYYVGSEPGYIAGGDPVTSGNGTVLRTDNALHTQEMNEVQVVFGLDQNFPNPFRLSTEIGFYVPQYAPVSLKVYDILGRQVAELINEKLQPGHYTKTFDASELQGGMYFYRLQALEFIQTRKLFLQK